MRYIKKQDEIPSIISEWVSDRQNLKLAVKYEYFDKKKELNDILRGEQHGVCCYCQRSITHYGPIYNPLYSKKGGAHNEHLYPENIVGDPVSQAKQMEYTNLFACCVDSQGHKKREKHLRYCGEAKGNKIIREFIKEQKCQTYFRYLSTGEIVPNGSFTTLKAYEEATSLSQDEKDAFEAIKILNLNCHTLVEDRKSCLTELLRLLPTRSKEEWQQTIDGWLSATTYPPYIELRLQYLQKFLSA